MQLIIKTTTTLVHLLNLLAVIQVACDIQQSGLLVESWTRDEVEKIQNWPKLGPDLGQESLLALASGSGSGYFGRYQRAAAAVASRSHKQQSQAKELEKETDPIPPFITVSDDVQTHLSAANQLQRVIAAATPANKPTTKQAAAPNKQTKSDRIQQLMLDQVDSTDSGPPGGESGIHTEASSSSWATNAAQPSPLRHRAGKLVAASGAIYARRHQQAQQDSDQFSRLYLDTGSMPLEVAAHVGQTAYLVCRLRSIHNQQQQPLSAQPTNLRQPTAQQDPHHGLQISWRRNMQILTSGLLRFTSDERFQATHVAGSNDWLLEIHDVQPSDEGSYECQVNSEPKPASVSLYLRTMLASIEILEVPAEKMGQNRPRLLEVQEDDQIRLTCRVDFNPAVPSSELEFPDEGSTELLSSSAEHPMELDQNQNQDQSTRRRAANKAVALTSQHFIFWLKDGISLEYNNPRGGIKVERRDHTLSMEKTITLEGASGKADSGTYQCKIQPELSGIAPVQVQVIVGGDGGGGGNANSALARTSLLLINLLLPTLSGICLLFGRPN